MGVPRLLAFVEGEEALKKTTVVNVQSDDFDIYVGRAHVLNGVRHAGLFGNPFKIGRHGTRGQVIERYGRWLAGESDQGVEPERRQQILEAIPTLQGSRLGCWCVPFDCHGRILAEFADASASSQIGSRE